MWKRAVPTILPFVSVRVAVQYKQTSAGENGAVAERLTWLLLTFSYTLRVYDNRH